MAIIENDIITGYRIVCTSVACQLWDIVVYVSYDSSACYIAHTCTSNEEASKWVEENIIPLLR